jgi:hypothetical protein
MVRRIEAQVNLYQKLTKSEVCLKELSKIQHGWMKSQEEQQHGIKDPTSLYAKCRKEWKNMTAFFEENPFRDFTTEDSCLYCADLYCKQRVWSYDARRPEFLKKLKELQVGELNILAKRYPNGLQHVMI